MLEKRTTMTEDEARQLSQARTYCRSESVGEGIVVILNRITTQMGGLWQEEVTAGDFAEASATIAASEAAITAGLESRSRSMRSCAEALDAKLEQFQVWKAEDRAAAALAA